MRLLFAALASRLSFLRWMMLRYIDLLIMPFLLEAAPALLYLAARVISLCVPAVLSFLERRAVPHLSALADPEPSPAFQALAGRVNLGFMMIAGSLSLAMVWGTPFIAAQLGLPLAELREILVWLILGQCAPVFFGATRMMMHAVGRGAFVVMLEGFAVTCFLIALSVGDGSDPVFYAQAVAAAQLTQSGLSALLLTQCGVWPGLSALFHPTIRLR